MIVAASLAAILLLMLAAPLLWPLAGRPAVDRLDSALGERDRLHYIVHLTAGRTLSLCPCAHGRVETQYWKASVHADTHQERALITEQRPRGPLDAPRDAVQLGRYGVWVVRNDSEWRTAAATATLAAALGAAVTLSAWRRGVRRSCR